MLEGMKRHEGTRKEGKEAKKQMGCIKEGGRDLKNQGKKELGINKKTDGMQEGRK